MSSLKGYSMDANGSLKKVNSTAVFASTTSGTVFEGKWRDWFSGCIVCTNESSGEGNGEGNAPTEGPVVAAVASNGSSNGIESALKVPSPAVIIAPVAVAVSAPPTVEIIVAAAAPPTAESAVAVSAPPAVESPAAVAVLPPAHSLNGSTPTVDASPGIPPAAQAVTDTTAAVTREHSKTPQNAGEKHESTAVISPTPPAVIAPSVSSPLHTDVNTTNGTAPAAVGVIADAFPVTAVSATSEEKCLDAVVMEEKHVSPPIIVAISESVPAELPTVQSNENHSITKEQNIVPEKGNQKGNEKEDGRIQHDSEKKIDLNDSSQSIQKKEKVPSEKVNNNTDVVEQKKEKGTNNSTPTTHQDDLNVQKSCCFSFFGFNL
jgi:hypothetical protein